MDEVSESPIKDGERRGIELQEITNAVVRIYKEQFGRGPTKARSDYGGPDALLVTVEDSLTPAERHMVALNEDQRVREIRMFFQHAAEREFRETIEQITGRKVRAFVSGVDAEETWLPRSSISRRSPAADPTLAGVLFTPP